MKKAIRVLAVILTVFMLSTTVLADHFTPSVEQKGAPDIVTTTDKAGEEVAAIITDSEDKEVVGVPKGEIIITSVAEAPNAETAIKEALRSAQEAIQNATSLGDLVPNQKEELSKAVADAGLKIENLVVRDLIDITLKGEYKDALAVSGNTITLTFKLDIGADEFLTVLHNYEADKWEMIPSQCIEIQENGDVSVTLDNMGSVAFVVDKPDNTDTVEPTTPWLMYALIGAAVVVAFFIIILLIFRKKKSDEDAKTE